MGKNKAFGDKRSIPHFKGIQVVEHQAQKLKSRRVSRFHPRKRDARTHAMIPDDDLAALLSAAQVPPPYLLVGSSAGGTFVQLYSAKHPEQVRLDLG